MKKLFFAMSACMSLAAISLSSCKKMEKQQIAPNIEGSKELLSMFSSADLPKMVNGMLEFRDDAHYDSYLDFLNQEIASTDPDDPDADAHSVLQNIESSLGFTSIRSTAHAAFMQQNEIGWATIDEIPEEHFLKAIDLRSILNEDLECKIGNDLIHYINKDYMVRVDAGQAALIDQYRRLGANAIEDNVLSIDPWRKSTTVVMLTGNGTIWDILRPTPLGDDYIFPPTITFPDPCNNPRLANFNTLALMNGVTSFNGYFKINYGDGSAWETKYAVPTLGGYQTPSFTHLYTGTGTYSLTVYAYNMSNQFRAQYFTNVTVVNGCRIVEKSSGWQQLTVPAYPNRAVGGRLSLEYYGSGNQKMRMIAETRSLEYKNNGWKLKSGRIEVEAACSAKNSTCGQIDLLQAYQLKGDHKDLLEHRSKNQRFYWSTAASDHYLTVHETRTKLSISITACP